MSNRPACIDCEYGQRQIVGIFGEYTATEDLQVICRCPQRVKGKCTCREGASA